MAGTTLACPPYRECGAEAIQQTLGVLLGCEPRATRARRAEPSRAEPSERPAGGKHRNKSQRRRERAQAPLAAPRGRRGPTSRAAPPPCPLPQSAHSLGRAAAAASRCSVPAPRGNSWPGAVRSLPLSPTHTHHTISAHVRYAARAGRVVTSARQWRPRALRAAKVLCSRSLCSLCSSSSSSSRRRRRRSHPRPRPVRSPPLLLLLLAGPTRHAAALRHGERPRRKTLSSLRDVWLS